MFRKHSLLLIFVSLILLLVVACVTAPTAVPTHQQPMSTSNPDGFATMVAGTAAVYMTQTMQAMPSPTATLPPPTETPTSIPTSTATATATDVSEKTSLSEMEDDSTQFYDYQAGIKLILPPGWLAVRLGEPEFMDVYANAVPDPILQHQMEAVQDLDPVLYRLHAFNTQEGYRFEGEGSSIAVMFVEGNTEALTSIAEVEVQPKNFDGYALITSGYQVRADDLELFTLEESWQVTSSTEQSVLVYHKRVVFKVTTGTVYIDLYVPSEIKDNVLPEFDAMLDTMSIFTP